MDAREKTPAELLATPVQFLRGVGPQRAELLERLELATARDVLFNFPRGYQDLTDVRSVADLQDGAEVSVVGIVEDVDQRTITNGVMLGVLIGQESGRLRGLWFNQSFLLERFRFGQRVLFSGKVRLRGLVWEMHHPKVQWLDDPKEEAEGKLLPLYSLCDGLHQGALRNIVKSALETYSHLLEEVFPREYLAEHRLWPLQRALSQIHFPENHASLDQARRRLVYQELFVLQLALALKRRLPFDRSQAPPLEATAKIDARIRRLIPFELTAGQDQAIAQVAADMARSVPMNRLLQGDVGSGKTMVSLYAMLLAVAHGCQAVLMAPTEILARQHAQTLEKLLGGSHVRRGVLTGGLPAKERSELLARLAAGEIDLVIGTHALLQPDVKFARLGLVVIDEQHKFGVRERAGLKQSALDPHYLVMTATPIPRTVTMTLFGDLDVSTLKDAPPGRQKVHTYLATAEQRGRWWDFVRKKLREGRQGYVITPLVDESEQVSAASVQQAYETLANGELEAFRLGLVHGRMSSAEKDSQMEAFRRGETQVLVATTVVEVGVDVPNATLMTIEGGERFGLSQLHQLRGRVSRGSHSGFCSVFAETENNETRRRLDAFAKSSDGFELAELDFQIRGYGDLFGTRQHGLPPLRIADLSRDGELLEEARRDAQQLVAEDPALSRPEHARLRAMALRRYGKVLDLGDVG